MEKLELKHIKPYSNLKVAVYERGEKKIDFITGYFELPDEIVVMDGFGDYFLDMTEEDNEGGFKLLLHPLSRLTETIMHNSEMFIPIDVIGEYNEQISERMFNVCQNDYITDADYDVIQYLEECKKPRLAEHHVYFLPFGLVQKLFEWYFDVFGLIEKGLAEPIKLDQ